MTGRQITAPPEQPVRPFSVGKWRSVETPVTLKGSRALLKVYTDVRVEADEPKVWYNMGLEPTIALVDHSYLLTSFCDRHRSTSKRGPRFCWQSRTCS